ncbi:aldo keto reductase [Micractinium conductrix]|uniref:Aldo keto reductase n=1 Tax=Micractinium conductrix TaxID=554055 RepID=A0A2P6VCC0_9CHLO|nr:aldo keto reductase [Micractinium conductrix]|eukprot:PSC71724.1 aldo keto reductase [Micractinium conductrix]
MASLADAPKRRLGALEVPAMGLGCMGTTAFYGPADEAEGIATIRRAIELGCTLLDTSDVFGPFTNEELVGKAIEGVPRDKLIVCTKFGIMLRMRPDGTPDMRMCGTAAHCKAACKSSLKRLGLDYIDVYYLHRKSSPPAGTQHSIEESITAMKELVQEGKVKHIGVSESVTTDDLRKAHAIHPITAFSWNGACSRGTQRVI